MSNNRLKYDTCKIKNDIKYSMKPGEYVLNPPITRLPACFR